MPPVYGTYDGKNIILDKPLDAPANARVVVEIVQEDGKTRLPEPPERGKRGITLDDVAGRLKYYGPPVSLEDMEKAIEKGIKEDWGEYGEKMR